LTGLTDYITYRIVVASIDSSDNVGPVSALECAYTEPVNDYWNTYKDDNGSTNGCALEGTGANAGVSGFAVGLLGAAATFLRRRRRP
jgi:MYXO-CTERM domain-containing protein